MGQIIEFLNMGGYALYVWGSFGVTAILMVAEPIMLAPRRREILRRVVRIASMKQDDEEDE